MPTEPSGRRPLKSRGSPFFKKLAARLAVAGMSPNAISFSSILFGGMAGVALAATSRFEGWQSTMLFLAAAACIQLRLVANLLDGMVAVEGRRGGPTGDLWNEAPDRFADCAIFIGAGFAPGSHPLLGFGAALVAMFVAYVRALGSSVGAGQCFIGPQAKPHRMAVLTVACALSAVFRDRAPFEESFIALALWIVILGGAITAWRRLAFISQHLRGRKA